jgi:uncharacterized protein YndB with AHSA1/START domain
MVTLVVRRAIRATPEQAFDAWTRPDALRKWWGPPPVICIAAEVDLSVGGRYRIGNQFPDGKVLWISGEFESIERPRGLVYTWTVDAQVAPMERVTVTFTASGQGTEVVVTHERIGTEVLRDLHAQGWSGCLGRLAEYFESGRLTEQVHPPGTEGKYP